MAALGLDAPRLKALLRTRARLTLRQFLRERGRIVGLLLSLFLFVPLILGAAVGTAIGYFTLPDPWPAQLLGIVLVALWLAWIALPLVAFNLNEGMDLTRLLVYPIARRDLVAAMILGTLFDYPTYFMLPLFLAILVGWGGTVALPVVLLALLLGYGQMIFSSQLLLAAAGGILSSRRFRDVAIILTALLGSSCYLLQQAAAELFSRYISPEQLQTLRPLLLLQWLPPGAAARAIERATAGAWPAALVWLLYATAWTLLLGWIWWRLTLRLVTGGGFLLNLPARSPRPRAAAAEPAEHPGRRPFAWLPADVAALTRKELQTAWRTPRRRVALLQGLFMPLALAGFVLFSGGIPDAFPPWLGLTLPFYALFSTWMIAQNSLGWEGQGLSTLLLTPVPRARICRAKGLALGILGLLPILPLGVVMLVLVPSTFTIAGLLAAFAAVLVALGVTGVASVLFPFPVRLEGARTQTRTGGGCVSGLANGLLVPAAVGILSFPLILPLGLSYWFELPALSLAGSALGILYGLALFWFGTGWAGRLLQQREPEVIEATRLPDEE